MNQPDQLTYLCAQIQEIGARARRTETQLHKIREHLGVQVPIHAVAIDSGKVQVPGHDVTLSQIKRVLEAMDWFEISDPVQIVTESGTIAVVTFLS